MAFEDSLNEWSKKIKETRKDAEEFNKKRSETIAAFFKEFNTWVLTTLNPKFQALANKLKEHSINKVPPVDNKQGTTQVNAFAFVIPQLGRKTIQIDFVGNGDHQKVFVRRTWGLLQQSGTPQIPNSFNNPGTFKEEGYIIDELTPDKIDTLFNELFLKATNNN